MVYVLTACSGQQSGEADLNPKVLGCFGVFFPPTRKKKKKRQMLLLAIRQINTWVGELLKIGKTSS